MSEKKFDEWFGVPRKETYEIVIAEKIVKDIENKILMVR